METTKINAALGNKAPRFQELIATLEAGLTAKKIWNVQVVDAKFSISNMIDDAAKFYSEPFYAQKRNQSANWVNGDPRYDISMFMVVIRHLVAVHHHVHAAVKFLTVGADRAHARVESFVLNLLRGFLNRAASLHHERLDRFDQRADGDDFFQELHVLKNDRIVVTVLLGQVAQKFRGAGGVHAGYRVGKCFGVGYKPYELSNEANVAFAPVLANYRTGIKKSLATLPKLTEVIVNSHKWEGGKRVAVSVTYTKEANQYEFNQEIASRQSRLEYELRTVEDDIKINNAKVENWTLQPLAYGSKAAV